MTLLAAQRHRNVLTSSPIRWKRSYRAGSRDLGCGVPQAGPSVDDGVSTEVIHGGHDVVLEFLFGCDADMAQDRAGELGEEAFDEIEPR